MALAPPRPVLAIVKTLRRAGHETWCVGGAVRDALMGHANLDWDLATAARPQQVRRIFDRTIPVGIEFGTVGVLDADGRMHEVTTFRRDVEHDGRHAVVVFGASLDEDLARRDFTINAIAYDPIDQRLHDPFHGQADLAAKLVRAVGDANERMTEDRLRALRAIRFASRFDFEVEAATWSAIVSSAPFLPRLSPERVKQEMEKTMDQVACPSGAFQRWRNSGAFASVVPMLATVSDDHLAAIDCLLPLGTNTRPQRRILRLAALFSGGTGPTTEAALRALRFSNVDVAWTSALVHHWTQEHDALRAIALHGSTNSAEPLRRMIARVGRLRMSAFLRLAAAHWAVERGANRAAPSGSDVRRLYARMLRTAFRDPVEIADLAIDGDDLRRLGVTPGPAYGKILAVLLNDVLATPAHNQVAWLTERVAHIVASFDNHDGSDNTPRRHGHV